MGHHRAAEKEQGRGQTLMLAALHMQARMHVCVCVCVCAASGERRAASGSDQAGKGRANPALHAGTRLRGRGCSAGSCMHACVRACVQVAAPGMQLENLVHQMKLPKARSIKKWCATRSGTARRVHACGIHARAALGPPLPCISSFSKGSAIPFDVTIGNQEQSSAGQRKPPPA